jgi:hypothetical protein
MDIKKVTALKLEKLKKDFSKNRDILIDKKRT